MVKRRHYNDSVFLCYNYNGDNMIDEFIKYLTYQKNYSHHTVINYKNDIDDFVAFLSTINIANLNDVTYPDLRNYLMYLHNQNYKNTTINRKLSTLRSLYKYLVKNNYTTNNPLLLITSPKKDKKLPQFLYYEELQKLMDVPDLSKALGQRDRLILELLYATGVRVHELVDIKINDISGKTVKVLGKGNKERIVVFGDYALDILDTYLIDGRCNLLKDKQSEYLFLNSNGTNLSDRGVRLIIDSVITKAALNTHISPHTLRHTFATHMLNEGADLLTVKELLGHENLSTTGIYTHVTNERLRHLYRDTHPRAKE